MKFVSAEHYVVQQAIIGLEKVIFVIILVWIVFMWLIQVIELNALMSHLLNLILVILISVGVI